MLLARHPTKIHGRWLQQIWNSKEAAENKTRKTSKFYFKVFIDWKHKRLLAKKVLLLLLV
jgi:hypothetical protein